MASAARLIFAAALVAPLLFSLPTVSQEVELPNAPDASWKDVQAISSGTPIIVRSDSNHVACRFKQAELDTLACINSGEVDLQRSSIRKVETYNRAASTAVLAAAGAGLGIATVKLVSWGLGFNGWAKGSVYAGAAGMGAIMFFPIGYFTHPIHHTVYKVK